MYLNTLLAVFVYQMIVFFVVNDAQHVCAYWRKGSSTFNSSGCSNNKCQNETCADGINRCIALYTNKTGKLEKAYLGCEVNTGGPAPFLDCGKNNCPLESHNGGSIKGKYLIDSRWL